MNINDIPWGIPASKEKQALLNKEKIENIYLGQGLMFVPPVEAERDYNKYLIWQQLEPSDYPLDLIRAKWKAGDFYNSATLDTVWNEIQKEQFSKGFRTPEAFGDFIKKQSNETFEKLYQIDANEVATMQVDNLMQALRSVQKIVPNLMNGRTIDNVILPKKYKYSGHTDFVQSSKDIGLDIKIAEIPEIGIDGSQDIEGIRQTFEQVRDEGWLGIMIDQEHNNNASGFDRDEAYNHELASLLHEFKDSIIYFGDNAYKGLKEDILEPYPLMQLLVYKGITAFHYTSFSKIGNYRWTPSFKNILASTPGDLAHTEKLRWAFNKIQRSEWIWATADGAILMRELDNSIDFQWEVRVLNQYLKYIRQGLEEWLQGTGLEALFGKWTNGIFRCVPPEVTKKLNSGKKQAITVWDRINIWPLGDPETRKFFLESLGK